ncbi:MAG: mechanosensitive ion channel [Lachnospiraceae bacterium]|nr:mechanosensitive ion channel [Lachnospiraceae bacterium]
MNRKIKHIFIILLIAELILTAVFGVAVYMLQSKLITDKKHEELNAALERFEKKLEDKDERNGQLEDEFDSMYISKAKQAAFYIDHLDGAELKTSALENLASVMDVKEIQVITADGKRVTGSADPSIPLTVDHVNAAGSNCVETAGDISFRTYAAPLKNGNYAVLRTDANEFGRISTSIASGYMVYTPTYLGFNGSIIVFDEEGTIIYSRNLKNAYESDNIFEKGLSEKALKENTTATVKIAGERHYISFKWVEKDRTWVALSIPQSMIDKQITASVILLVFCFFSILSIFNVYIVFLYGQILKDINREISHAAQNKEKVDINSLMKNHARKLGRKVSVVVIIGAVIAFLLAAYVQDMSMISIRHSENQEELIDIEARLIFSEVDNDMLKELTKKILISKAVTAAYIIGEEPEIRNEEDLKELNSVLDTEYVVIFDQNGKEVVSNGRFVGISISDDSKDPSYQLRSLMYGNAYVYTEPVKGEYSGEVHQDIGAAIRTEGTADGFVVISNDQEHFKKMFELTEAKSIYESVNLLAAVPLVIDEDTKEIIYSDTEFCIGKDARNYGLHDDEIRDNFNGYITFFETTYYASSLEKLNGHIIFLITQRPILVQGSLPFALIICAMIIAGLIVCALINRLLVGKGLKKLLKGSIHVSKEEDEEYPYVDVIMPDGSVKRAITVLERFSLRDTDWDVISPEQKTATVIRIFVTILAFAAVVLMFSNSILFPHYGSIVSYILNLEWERNINIFSLTYCALIICVILMAEFILAKILGRLAIVANPKGETIIRMLKNLMKYVAVIVGLFLCLTYVGVNVTTLLAGAGLLTLVIGLGAQSLVSDILNGLFIIFESDFQVGDIVTIDNFRGTVQEIGIRTTKVMNPGGDLKIIRNSALKEILNMTRHNSRCMCEILIEYREDLNKTIETFTNEFDTIRANVPEIVDGPVFGGVEELAENGVKLLFLAYCNEKDRYACTFGINRELKLICERNGINIPFPQVVVHDGDK